MNVLNVDLVRHQKSHDKLKECNQKYRRNRQYPRGWSKIDNADPLGLKRHG